MKRLTISIDDLATIRYSLNDSNFDPVQFAMLCEVAGVHGICLTLADLEKGIQKRDAQLLKKVYKSFLNFRIPPDPQFIKTALSINPDMVTFVHVAKIDNLKISPLSSQVLLDVLPTVISDFHANNISVAAYCAPEISILRQLNRIQIDYVEFDCSEITLASDSNEELLGYDKLNTAALAAAKLGMGINCYGNIHYTHLPGFAAIPRLEDICMGLSIVKRAMLVGIDRAVREALDQILHHKKSEY